MKRTKYVFMIVAALVLLLGTALSVSADPDKAYDVSTAAFVPANGEGVIEGGAVLVTGFEPSEGFATGHCAQNGWTAFSASTTEGHIDTANPATGTQHMRISGDSSIAQGSLTGCFSPLLPASSTGVTMTHTMVDMFISGTGGADYDVAPQTPSQGFLTARVKFAFTGDVLILDDPGGGLAFVDSGVDWTPNTWFTLAILADPANNTIDYAIDGTTIYTGSTVAGTIVEQVVLLSDNFQANESGDFDNVRIDNDYAPIPTDVSLTSFGDSSSGGYAIYFAPVLLLVLAGAFVAKRRKNEGI